MRSDDRKENTRNPKIDLKGFIYKNYKDLIAFILIVFCISILVCFDKQLSERVSTLLITLTSGSAGFIFGKMVS
jgi:hypothetical protein